MNYLIAVSDLVAIHPDIEIPVYQADAVYAPSVGRSRGPVGATRTYQVGTRRQAIELELPEALIQRNRLFGRLLEIMERTIRHGDPETIFLATLRMEPTYLAEPEEDRTAWEPLLLDLFRKIEQLERDDWNRIWCRIVRNYFASVAVGRCQYVAGNPPWVRWSELPGRYTERIKPTCEEYGIFSEDRFFGGNELDISGMITYTVADKWLDPHHGRLAFVITQTHFQSQSSGGFRRFNVKGTPLKVVQVDDFVKVRPFAGLGNKPAVLGLVKGHSTTYPVPYYVWERTTPSAIPEDTDWETAKGQLRSKTLEANPLSGPGRRWSLLPPGHFPLLRVLDGTDLAIVGRKGIVTDLNGGFFVELLRPGRRPGTIRVRNVPEEGRQQVPWVTEDVEADLVYPLIKGAENIRAFHATASRLHVVVPNHGITQATIPTPTQLAEQGKTGAVRFFRRLNEDGILDGRSTWRTRMRPAYERRLRQGQMAVTDIPTYAIYDVGEYTFAPYKVVWAEMAGTLQAGVIHGADVPHGGGHKPVVPDHKIYFAAFEDPDHAHYVCAFLNSTSVREFVDSFTIKIQVGTIFRHVRLPGYDSTKEEHAELVRYSREAHRRLAEAQGADITHLRSAIDRLAYQVLASTTGY